MLICTHCGQAIKNVNKMVNSKLCSSCTTYKPLTEFYVSKYNGVLNICKECIMEDNRQRKLKKKQYEEQNGQ